MKAYRETVDWMYSDPAALKTYAEFVGIPVAMAKRTRDEFFPKASVDPDKVVGLDEHRPGCGRAQVHGRAAHQGATGGADPDPAAAVSRAVRCGTSPC